MTSNSLESQALFRDSAEYLAKYQIALENIAGAPISQAFFEIEIKPLLVTEQNVKLYGYRRMLAEILLFNPYVKLNLAKLAMASAVFGENPKLSLSVNSEGKLEAIPETELLRVAREQFNDDSLLTQLLNQNILKISLVF